MLVNRWKEALAGRERAAPFVAISIDHVKRRMKKVKSNVNDLYVMQERHCLPSFVPRKQRTDEISGKKAEINADIDEVEAEIRRVDTYGISSTMRKNIADYLSLELHKVVHGYRAMQQDFLKKVSCMEVFDTHDECDESLLVSENVSQMNDVKQSIFGLTTTLMELKMVIGAQAWKLDRIEFFMACANENIKSANHELVVMPYKNAFVKNRVIFILTCLVIVLFFLSVAKVSRHRA